jgi:hypothetical protein
MVEHVDPDVLALVALGERPTAADAAHLDRCRTCAAEVASLAAVVAVGRSVRADDALVPPAPAVWDRVRDELGLAPDVRPGRASEASAGPTSPQRAPGVPLRRRAAPWAAAAAACGVVVGAAGGVWWAGLDRVDEPVDEAGVIAQAPLEPLPGWTATGSARVEQDAAGDRTLVVTLEGAGTDDGYHEVWLIDRDVTRLVSLGVLTGSQGRFTVPPDHDLTQFPVVDVSDEPLDGDPAHSGDSIIRGVLDA